MLPFRRLLFSAVVLIVSLQTASIYGQTGCVSPFQYPFGMAFTPDPTGAPTLVDACIYLQEYTHFNGLVSGSTYRFDITGNGFITLRQGTVEGPVVAMGYSYVIYTATSNADIYAHYTKNANCVFTTGCQENSVQLLLGCIPPQVWYSWEEDCATNEFDLQVDVMSLGDAASLTVQVTSAGVTGTFTNVGAGLLNAGTFNLGDEVTILVTSPGSNDCDISITGVSPFSSCPILLECGGAATSMQYCYANSEDLEWSFQGLGTGSLSLNFLSGTVGGGDVLMIYDGPDASSPVLLAHNDWTDLSIAGASFLSSGPDIHMVLVSDGWGSCQDFYQTPWDIEVSCLNCNVPQVTTMIVDDCPENQFTIDLDVASTGDGSNIDIAYTVNGGAPVVVAGIGAGETELGPFQINDLVVVNVQHEQDAMCNFSLGTLTDDNTCPTLIVCGEDQFNESYCYENNSTMHWSYELVGQDGSLFLQFTGGIIEAYYSDQLTIYDGADASAPILFQHTGEWQTDLTGLAVTSTSGYLYMTLTADGWGSCDDNGLAPWNWLVTCLDCQPAIATYQIVQDCDNFQYSIDVDVSNIGSQQALTITNTGGFPAVSITAPGVSQLGPFTSGVPVQITLVNDDNALCNVVSPMLVNPLCPTIICGTTPLEETYCYGPEENMAWAYGLPGEGQIRLVFDLGSIESSYYDVLRIYDGESEQAPLLFEHTQFGDAELGPPGSAIIGPGNYYYGVDVTSTGPNLYMTLTSDGSIECATWNYDPMQWRVFCEGCPAPGVSYDLVPDCEHLIYKAIVNVTEVNGPLGLQITEMVSGEILNTSTPDLLVFSTFHALDSTIYFKVEDLDNVGCTYETGPMVYTRDSCVINSCGVDNYEICYENNEDRWFTYRSVGDFPVALYIYQGLMLPNDIIVIYNGLSDDANMIFTGNNNGNLAGITANSSNSHNALTLRIRSNAEGSCVDGQITVPLRWDVGCGFVGVEEHQLLDLHVFPNPAQDQLTIEMGDLANGISTLRVLDMSGRVAIEQEIASQNGPRTTIDLAKLQNGQYMVQLITKDRVDTRKFQIMR